MILNAKGEPMRRQIGFLRAMTRVSQPKADISTHACGFSIPIEETEVEEASERFIQLDDQSAIPGRLL